MLRVRTAFVLAIVAHGATASHTQAGLYSPAEPCPFEVRPDGTAKELTYGTATAGEFRIRYTVLLNAGDVNPARTENADRKKYLDRIAASRQRRDLTPAELAGLAADLLRVRDTEAALDLLAPRSRDRNPDFRILANLAHAHALRKEWSDALRIQSYLAFDYDVPEDLAGTTPAQRAWLQKLERKHYRRWLEIHQERDRKKSPPSEETIFPLFEVNFVGESGKYEPGKQAAAEKAKLPPDAIAIVQQLMLWDPDDAALQWLLAELYAASGRLRESESIFNQVVESRQYSNRPLFMEHRAAVRDAVAKLPPESSPEDVALPPTSEPAPSTDPDPKSDDSAFLPSTDRVVVVLAAFGAFLGFLVFLKLRSRSRRYPLSSRAATAKERPLPE